MVMEVVKEEEGAGGRMRWHRRAGAVAVSGAAGSPYSVAGLMSDFASSTVRAPACLPVLMTPLPCWLCQRTFQ